MCDNVAYSILIENCSHVFQTTKVLNLQESPLPL